MAFYLAFYLTFFLAFFHLAFYLAFVLAYILAFYLAFVLAYFLAFFLAVEVQQCPLGSGGPRSRSNGVHWAREVGKSPVEVQRCPLDSRVPACWQLRSSSADCDQELARRRGGEEEEARRAILKSNNHHLAGGEKTEEKKDGKRSKIYATNYCYYYDCIVTAIDNCIYGGWTSLLHASVLLFIKLSRALES